jgi:hypothetical protein
VNLLSSQGDQLSFKMMGSTRWEVASASEDNQGGQCLVQCCCWRWPLHRAVDSAGGGALDEQLYCMIWGMFLATESPNLAFSSRML